MKDFLLNSLKKVIETFMDESQPVVQFWKKEFQEKQFQEKQLLAAVFTSFDPSGIRWKVIKFRV